MDSEFGSWSGLGPHRFSFGKSREGDNCLSGKKFWKCKSWNSLLLFL